MLLAFVMIPLLQNELDTFKHAVWNTHRIRPQKDQLLPNGVPNHIFDFPEEYGLEDCGKYLESKITNLICHMLFTKLSTVLLSVYFN